MLSRAPEKKLPEQTYRDNIGSYARKKRKTKWISSKIVTGQVFSPRKYAFVAGGQLEWYSTTEFKWLTVSGVQVSPWSRNTGMIFAGEATPLYRSACKEAAERRKPLVVEVVIVSSEKKNIKQQKKWNGREKKNSDDVEKKNYKIVQTSKSSSTLQSDEKK